ncbi:MAG: FAD-binding protein, partial [Proteobacteria bacterium]|nr:FAD-binding protein [Pseudomonadota bacterium]
MELSSSKPLACDVLVIGGGGAGLTVAIEAREMGADVLVVSKSRAGYGNNTILSKATFAAASGWSDSRDNPEVHLKDTLFGGRFINDQKLVAAVARGSGAQIAFLEKCGVRFIKEEGRLRAIHLPGHSYPRHVRAEHQTGRSITLPLREHARKQGVRFADRVLITKLFASREGRISAAVGMTREGSFLAFCGHCCVLATGGFGQVYLQTNNAPGITGNGQALAFELGLPLKDMEFVQFYPTAAG